MSKSTGEGWAMRATSTPSKAPRSSMIALPPPPSSAGVPRTSSRTWLGAGPATAGLFLRVVRVAHTSLLTKAVASLRRPDLLHGMLEPLDLGVSVAVGMRRRPRVEGGRGEQHPVPAAAGGAPNHRLQAPRHAHVHPKAGQEAEGPEAGLRGRW